MDTSASLTSKILCIAKMFQFDLFFTVFQLEPGQNQGRMHQPDPVEVAKEPITSSHWLDTKAVLEQGKVTLLVYLLSFYNMSTLLLG